MAMPAEETTYTFADLLTWPEGERYELIDGVPYMQAAPSREHQSISGALFLQIGNYLADKPCQVYAAPFGVRLFAEAEDKPEDVEDYFVPDITVVCDPEKLDDRGCHGAPDWIIEILSPSSRRHDLFVKYKLYEKAGVREYWTVDPMNRSVQVFVLENGFFRNKAYQEGPGKLVPAVFPELEIDVAAFFPTGPEKKEVHRRPVNLDEIEP